MKTLQKISDMIDDEIIDAWKYARCYQTYKEEDPELAKMFSMLATEELGHIDKLHIQGVRLIKLKKEETENPPKWMESVYNYLHERNIKRMAEVKALLV